MAGEIVVAGASVVAGVTGTGAGAVGNAVPVTGVAACRSGTQPPQRPTQMVHNAVVESESTATGHLNLLQPSRALASVYDPGCRHPALDASVALSLLKMRQEPCCIAHICQAGLGC